MTGTAITVNGARRTSRGGPRLRARTVAAATLDPATRARAFALFQRAYDGADRARFERDLAEKQRVILLHDRETGDLKGFSTLHVSAVRGPRGAATAVFSGDTVIDRGYWGQKQLQTEFVRQMAALKIRAPRRPLYWFLISKGWRTYLLLANSFPHAVPRHDRAEGGDGRDELRRVLDGLAVARFGDQYDRCTGVIRYRAAHERVRAGLAPVEEALLANPHVRFFVERNPGHAEGDELACLAEVRARDLAACAIRFGITRARRAIETRARTGGYVTRPGGA